MNQFMVGTDPEVFVKDIKTKEIQSSIGILPGTKEKPFAVNGGFVHKDNVLAELNTTPATGEYNFVDNVLCVLAELKEILRQKGKTYEIIPSYELDEKYTSHFLAQRFGCDPFLNVWELDKLPRVFNSAEFGNLRTAGGHIHIGFDEPVTIENQVLTAMSCDIHMGLPSVIMDKDMKRKSLYGVAGAFRAKDYGIEYRVLSNFWMKNTNLMFWVYRAAANSWYDRHRITTMSEDTLSEVRDTINKNDEKNAKKLCNNFGVSYG